MHENAIFPPPIYGLKCSPTSDYYNASESTRPPTAAQTSTVPPPLILRFNYWLTIL